jgi:hypothetical protein
MYHALRDEEVSVGRPEKERPLGKPSYRWRMILKWILQKDCDSSGSVEDPLAGCCEHGDEPSDFMKGVLLWFT